MSATKSLRKRPQVNYKDSEGSPRKKIKTEKVESTTKVVEVVQSKQPIIAPNGKIFYPCQYCSKIFPQKSTSLTHMKKCPNKNTTFPVDNKNINGSGSNINNNSVQRLKIQENKDIVELTVETIEEFDNRNSSENVSQDPKIKISQNITVKAAQPEKQLMNDTSIYDYNEQDDQMSEHKDLKENDEDTANNRSCKHCHMSFDNPLEVLRHTRDCHSFPRTILPPQEIEKYFDSPNREFCPICEKPIKTRNFRSVFIKHLLVHTTGLTHECSICKKKFRRRDHMRNHEKRHIVSV